MPNSNTGYEEIRYLELAKRELGSGHTKMIDVGMNRSYFTETWLEYFPDSEVFGFEPIPDIYEISKEKFKNDNRVHIENYGLLDEAGKMNFYYLLDGIDGCSSLFRRPVFDKFNYKEIDVDIRVFDVWRHKFPRVDFIKIDVEGLEFKVLKGMRQYIGDTKPKFIQLEIGDCNLDANISFKEIWDLVESYGYEIINRDLNIITSDKVIDIPEGQNYLAILKDIND